MTPRLAVTQSLASLIEYVIGEGLTEHALRLPERPTMPCPECGGYATDRWRCDGVEIDVVCNYCNGQSVVPIPEGTRVEVGWWEPDPDDILNHDGTWHHVATATLAEVKDKALLGEPELWLVTLSDIEPAGEDQ